MAYKCLNCGHIFDEGEEKRWQECVGVCWGETVVLSYCGCPLCEGDYDDTVGCEICGSEHLPAELYGGVCEECIQEHRYDVSLCYTIGAYSDKDVELNSFLAEMFTKAEIEEILFKSLKEEQKYSKIDCAQFIKSDMHWFGECLAEEVNKNEN